MEHEWLDVEQALERRRAAFAERADVQLPISDRVARFVYDAAGGELRFMFARLSRTVLEFSVRYPSERTIPDRLALAILREWGEHHLSRHRLTPREGDVVRYLQSAGAVRPRDHEQLRIGRSQ